MMKKFIVTTLCVSVFFLGLGALAENVGAKFISDEKALDLVRKARLAIGGDQALTGVRNLVIKGGTTYHVNVEGLARMDSGETEIGLEFPNTFIKKVKVGGAGGASETAVVQQSEVFVVRKSDGETADFAVAGKDVVTTDGGKTIILKRADGTEEVAVAAKAPVHRFEIKAGENGEFATPDGKKVIVTSIDGGEITTADGNRVIVRQRAGDVMPTRVDGVVEVSDEKKVQIRQAMTAGALAGSRSHELLRTALMLLLEAPEGTDVAYSFVGESTVDGIAVNTVKASAGAFAYNLHLDRYTNVPVAIGYFGHLAPTVIRMKKDDATVLDGKAAVAFTGRTEGPVEKSEILVRLSDYRSTGGVQLPYKWTTIVRGEVKDVFDVASYEINVADFSERFPAPRVLRPTMREIN